MLMLDTTPRVARPDDLYARLIAAHDGLDDDASLKLNAKLVLILANHIGDVGIIDQAIDLACHSVGKELAA
jgi:Protein of unknown function (DUF2783)